MKKRTLKLLSYLLTVCMLVSSISVTTFALPSANLVEDDDTIFIDAWEMYDKDEIGGDEEEGTTIKNIIYMIPDGAGYGSYDFSNDVKIAGGFDNTKFPYRTQVNTDPMTLRNYHAGSMVTLNIYNAMTDSAAAGSALSTGVKTINNYVGVDRRKMPRANLTEAAQSVGKATGIIATYEWTHATPASFTAHSVQRTAYGDFYRQIENKGLQVVLGSGYGAISSYGGSMNTAINNGYTIVSTKEDMAAVKPGDKLWGNVYETSFDFDIYNTETMPTLAEMTSAAITALSADEDGFFLMVEGSKVDTGGHANDSLTMSSDYIAFDEAFRVAVEFAKGRKDTIVIAVPDHDTGELQYDALVASGNLAAAVAETQSGRNSGLVAWGTGSHSVDNVPFWCYYPEGVEGIEGAKAPGEDYYGNPARLENVIDNTDIAPWAASFMGVDLDELTKDLFVNVTDIGIYDAATEKFTFNNGDKYAFKDQAVYYKNGAKTEMLGQMIVIDGTVYLPAEVIDEEDWNYVTEDFDGITGSGTEADPFIIDDAWDFLEFTNNMISGENYNGKYFSQKADIDMTSKPAYNGVLSDVSFAGYYDGNGYTVTVNIDTTSGNSNAVLFGINDGTIVNLGVLGNIKSAGGYAAIVRKNNTNGKIVNCFSAVNVSASASSGNGFTISNYGKIENVYFGGVASHHPITGGSNVTNGYYVEGSTHSNSTAGTLVSAETAATTLADTLTEGMTAAAATLGKTTEALNKWTYIGGTDYPVLKVKTPEVTGITLTPSATTVKRGEAATLTAKVLGNYNPSQSIVWELSPTPTSKETKLYEDGFFKIGEDETVGQFMILAKSAVAGNFAISSTVTVDLASDPVVKEDGSRAHPYLIENEDDFMEFTNNVNTGVNQYSGKYLKQTRDLDMDGYEGYMGMYTGKYFTGIYDGDGHTINVNIYVERDEKTEIDDVCLFGYISSARILNLGVTGSIKAPGYVSTFARNMGSASLFANCWSTVHVESIAKGFGSSPGNDASGFVRSPYGGAFVNCYFAGTLVSPGGTSHPIGGAGDSYLAEYYNCYYLGREYYEDEEQTEITEKQLEEGFAIKLNQGIAKAAEVATENAESYSKTYVYVPAMFHEWVDDIGGPRHHERDDSSRLDKEIEGDKTFTDLVIGSDSEVAANGNVVSINNLVVKEGATLNLGMGTYVIGNAEGNITASPNANIIVTGENKPEGYVEFNLGEAFGTRYAEVNGYQYEITENANNLYGVITDKSLVIEVVEYADASLASDDAAGVTTKYYYVDAEDGKAVLLDTMTGYMENHDGYSLRYPSEKTNNKSAIRFKAYIEKLAKYEEEAYVIDEYGYIITLEEKLNNNDYAQLNFDFSVPTGTAYVTGVAYDRLSGKNIVFESDDEIDAFTGVIYGVPTNSYGKRFVAKTYTKLTVDGEQFIVYGEPMVTSLYSVAKDLVNSGEMSEDDENYSIVKDIIDAAVEDGFGNDAGADTGDLWN